MTTYLSKETYCSYCNRDLSPSSQCYFKCANEECSTLGMKFCSDCFSSGVTISPHVKTHAYSVADCLEFPLFAKDWTAADELLMLDGTEIS